MDSMTAVYFLRHAESEMNVIAADIVGGRSNHTELTAKGQEQAALAGRWLLAHNIIPDTVYCSPARRTLHTTELALAALGISDIQISTDPRLQELSQGVMEGRARHEVWTPDTVKLLGQDPMNFKFEKGETVADVQLRKLEWLQEIESKHPDSIILVGAHGLAIRSLVGALKGWDHSQIMHAANTPNCSLTLIESAGDKHTVQFLGRDIAAEQLALET